MNYIVLIFELYIAGKCVSIIPNNYVYEGCVIGINEVNDVSLFVRIKTRSFVAKSDKVTSENY